MMNIQHIQHIQHIVVLILLSSSLSNSFSFHSVNHYSPHHYSPHTHTHRISSLSKYSYKLYTSYDSNNSINKRKRRRRKEETGETEETEEQKGENLQSNTRNQQYTNQLKDEKRIIEQLPDFVLQGEEDETTKETTKKTTNTVPPSDLLPPPTMGSELESIGTSGISRDRSLERAFEFDEINEPLPRAKDLLKTRRGKKKVRDLTGGDEQEDKRSYNER
jgi:hypothetical protein